MPFRSRLKYLRLRPFDTSTAEGRSHERYRRALLTSLASGLARTISVSTGLLAIPLTLRYLGTERYGLWMTISSVVAFMSFSDLGINNGLMNGIAKAHGRDDLDLAKQYTSSALFSLSVISLLLGILFAAVYRFVPWGSFFRVHSSIAIAEAGPAVAVFTGCFLLNIPIGTVSRIQAGYQEGFLSNLWASLGSVISLVCILIVIHLHGSLAFLLLAIAGAPLFAGVLNGAVLFRIQRPWLFPSWHYLRRDISRDLLHLGGLFFVLQLAGAVAFSSDNIVLTRILGPEAVPQYAVPSKLFSLVTIVSSFVTAPLWPAYGEALEKRDFVWIRKTLYRSLTIVATISFTMSTLIVIFARHLLSAWVGSQIHTSLLLLFSIAVWVVVSAISGTVAMFLNGVSVIRFQVIFALIGGSANICLSIVLTRKLGIPGVVLGSIVTQIMFGVIPYYWYVRRYFARRVPAGNGGRRAMVEEMSRSVVPLHDDARHAITYDA